MPVMPTYELDRRSVERIGHLYDRREIEHTLYQQCAARSDQEISSLLSMYLWCEAAACAARVYGLTDEHYGKLTQSWTRICLLKEDDLRRWWESLPAAERQIIYKVALGRRRLRMLLLRYCERHSGTQAADLGSEVPS